MTLVDCSLILQVGEGSIRLDCTCPPGAEYTATNALLEELRGKIKEARNRELAATTDAHKITEAV